VVESSFQEGSLRIYPIDGVLEPQTGTQTASTSGSTSGQQTGSSSSATGSSDQQSQTAADTSATGSALADLQNKAFSELDQDGDGYLNQDELKNAAGTTAADTATNQLDTDQDGQLSRSEFAAFEQSQGQSSDHSGQSSDHSGQSWEPESDPQHDQQ
jgi:Ca2+-binding EF-hand superfamily protein